MKKIGILFIVPSLGRAGAETQVVNLLNSFDINKFKIYLFTFHKNIDQYCNLCHERITFFNKPRKYKFDFSIVKNIANIINKEKIEIVHCTLLISLLIGWLSVKLSREKPRLLAAVHTTINRSLMAEIFEKVVFQKLLKKCDRVIFVCQKQAKYWYAKYSFLSNKSDVVYNGVDTIYFNPLLFDLEGEKLRESLAIPNGTPILCCIAVFRKEKGHDDLIEAFARLSDNVYLILAGDGDMKEKIELLVRKKGLEDRIRFLGQVSDVRPILAASDISVLASTAVETFSIAMLESMSMGVPVVATDIGGLSEAIIPGETGDLFLVGNSNMLAKKLANLLNNQNKLKAMQKICRETVIQKFSKEKMVSATERSILRNWARSDRK